MTPGQLIRIRQEYPQGKLGACCGDRAIAVQKAGKALRIVERDSIGKQVGCSEGGKEARRSDRLLWLLDEMCEPAVYDAD